MCGPVDHLANVTQVTFSVIINNTELSGHTVTDNSGPSTPAHKCVDSY